MNILPHKRPYVTSSNYDKRLMLAVRALEAIYQIDGPLDLKGELREKLFHTVVWSLTESDGKYSTRYRSKLALQARKGDLQHEHVFPIDDLYFLSRHGLSLKDALSLCCACIVTKEEHSRLTARDRLAERPFGWKRYQSTGIEVIDMLENRPITPQEMEALNLPYEEAMRHARFCGDGEVELERMIRAKENDVKKV
jgi:hypothetical protein